MRRFGFFTREFLSFRQSFYCFMQNNKKAYPRIYAVFFSTNCPPLADTVLQSEIYQMGARDNHWVPISSVDWPHTSTSHIWELVSCFTLPKIYGASGCLCINDPTYSAIATAIGVLLSIANSARLLDSDVVVSLVVIYQLYLNFYIMQILDSSFGILILSIFSLHSLYAYYRWYPHPDSCW